MKYDAFISYKHSELDMYVAKKVHKALETFKVPNQVAKKSGKKKIRRVFRDQEELPIGSDLGTTIEAALRESEYLIVICSPRAVESYWVHQEINKFIELHDRDHVLSILIEGEPEESFPKELLVDDNGNPREPLAADVRGANIHELNKKFSSEVMRLAAPILGCSYDDLRQRHRERRLKKITALVGAAGSLTTLLGIGFGLYNAKMAAEIQENLTQKQINQSKYLADTSQTLLKNGDREAAMLVALEALPGEGNNRPYVAQAEYALNNALYTYDTGNTVGIDRKLKHDLPVRTIRYDVDTKYLTSTDSNETIYLWDLETGTLKLKLFTDADEASELVTTKYANVVAGRLVDCNEKGLTVYDLDGNTLMHEAYDKPYVYVSDSLKTGEIYVLSSDEVTIYDINTLTKTKVIPNDLESYVFSQKVSTSTEGEYALISTNSDTETAGCAYIYRRDDESIKRLNLLDNSIQDSYVTDHGDAYFITTDYDTFIHGDSDSITLNLQKIPYGQDTPAWQYTLQMPRTYLLESDIYLKARSYSDALGEHNEVICSAGINSYTIDSETGELIVQTSVSNSITSLLISTDSALGFVSESDGRIDVLNFTRGTNLSSGQIETGVYITDMLIKKGILCLRSFQSSDVLMYKYHQGENMTEIGNYELNISRVVPSPAESNYMVRAGYGSDGTSYNFYDSETSELMSSFTPNAQDIESFASYINEDEFLFASSHGLVTVVNVHTGVQTVLRPSDSSEICFNKGVISADLRHVLLYHIRDLYYIDTQTKEITNFTLDREMFNTIDLAAIDSDGRKAYLVDGEAGIFILDLVTQKTVAKLPAEYNIVDSITEQYSMRLSSSGRYLAVSCKDNLLRVYDTTTGQTAYEVPFQCRNRVFVAFSSDESKIYMQGDDYYFKIYDLATGTYPYISSDNGYSIISLSESDDGQTFAYADDEALYIFSKEQNAPMVKIDKGKAYLDSAQKVLASYYGKAYSFPYSNLTALKEAAAKQFPDSELSVEDRITYHID